MRPSPTAAGGGAALRRWGTTRAVSIALAGGGPPPPQQQQQRAIVSSSRALLGGPRAQPAGRRRPLPVLEGPSVPWPGLGAVGQPVIRSVATSSSSSSSSSSARGSSSSGGRSPQRQRPQHHHQHHHQQRKQGQGRGHHQQHHKRQQQGRKTPATAPAASAPLAGAGAPATAKAPRSTGVLSSLEAVLERAGAPADAAVDIMLTSLTVSGAPSYRQQRGKGQERRHPHQQQDGVARPEAGGGTDVMRILRKYATIADVDGILRLLDYAGIPLDVAVLTRAISACGAAGEPAKALGLLEEMHKRGIKPDIFAYSAVISALARAGDWAGCLRVIAAMEEAGEIPVNTHVLNHLLTAYARGGRVDQALALLPEMWGPNRPKARPDTITYNILIHACVGKTPGKGRVGTALALAEEMRAKGVPFDRYTWAGVLGALAKQGRAKEALETLDAMKAAGARPDVYCYNNAILACCRHHQAIGPEEGKGEAGAASSGLAMAVRLFLEMAERGIAMDAVSYNAILTACAQGGHWGGARRLIEGLAARGVLKRNPYLCVASLRYCAQEADRGLVRVVERAGLPPDPKAYTWLLTALRSCELWEDIVRVAKEMEAVPLPPEQWPPLAWNILLHAHGRRRDGNEAYATFGRMLRTPGIKPDTFSFLQTIEACARSNQLVRALEILRLGRAYRVRLDARHYIVAASACARHGQWKTVTSLLLDDMRSAGIPLDSNAYTCVLHSYGVGGEWKQALALLGRLEDGSERQAPPVSVCNYNAAMMAVARAGQVEEIHNLFARLRARDLQPDGFTYAAAIVGCTRSGHVREARRLCDEAVTTPGVKLTMEVYGTIVNAYSKAGDVDEACRIFYASQADPALLNPSPHQRPRKTRTRLGMALLRMGQDGEDSYAQPAAALWRDDAEAGDVVVGGGGGGRGVAVPHYLYTSLISAFADRGAWAAALYLYEDFMLAHGPEALQRPLITAVARCVNPEPNAPGGELFDAWLRRVYEDAYVAGVFGHWSQRYRSSLDLHVCTGPIARMAVKMALDEIAAGKVPVGPQGLQVIVGQSATVVRDAVQRALTQECAPALALNPIADNPGRLLVPLKDLKAWAAAAVGGGGSKVRVDPTIEFKGKMDTRRTGGGVGVLSGDGGAGRRQRWQQLVEEEEENDDGESGSMK